MKNLVKKLLLGVFILTFVFVLGACNSDENNVSKEDSSDNPKQQEEKTDNEDKTNEDGTNEASTNEDNTNEYNTSEDGIEKIALFKTEDLDGNEVTQDIFKENEMTLVNVFSSACNPCVEELPHLAELSKEYSDKNIAILGINIDMDANGNPDEDSREAIKNLLSQTENNMTAVFLDDNLTNIIFDMTDAIPYTFFVDKEGNLIGERYSGYRSKEEWKEIIDKEFENLNK